VKPSNVTCILTSCGRFDLLRITLDSFFKFNTYDITDFIIYEDSGLPVPSELKKTYPFIRWIESPEQAGQIVALDILWSQVKTPFAFTMEDDWEFIKEGFIEESMEILKYNPTILQVWIKEIGNTNQHPLRLCKNYSVFKNGIGLWAWHRFNPSLKRKKDYDLIAPFIKYTTFNKNKGWKSEAAISKVYNNLGFTAAILPEPYIIHLGGGRRCV